MSEFNINDFFCDIVENSIDFWYLYDELLNDQSLFVYDRHVILDAFKEGNIYSFFKKPDSVKYTFKSGFYASGSKNMLPCFVVTNNEGDIEIIWVHNRMREKGVAKSFIRKLQPKKIINPLDDALDFWKKFGYTKENNLHGEFYLTKSEN